MDAIHKLGPYAAFCEQADMPSQVLELSAHGAANAPVAGCVESNFVLWQQPVGKKPSGVFDGKFDRHQTPAARKRIEILAQQVDNIVGGAAPVEVRTEIDTTNKVLEGQVVGGWRLLGKGTGL